jgi:hypothetical protein
MIVKSAPTFSLLVCTVVVVFVQIARSQCSSREDRDTFKTPQPNTRVPSGVILVKGALPSTRGSARPVPEDAGVHNNQFCDKYFGLAYTLPPGWIERFEGPPPSDRGLYVLGQFGLPDSLGAKIRASMLITAQDMFFTLHPVANAGELINYSISHLDHENKVEELPTEVKIANHQFLLARYWSPVARLHWYILATEARCHTLEIVLSSHDEDVLHALVQSMNSMSLSAEATSMRNMSGVAAPACIKDFAREENLISRVDPILTDHRSNPIPVRVTIDKRGDVSQIHFLSAFPEQQKAIADALQKWKFRPYRINGRAVEVETGILFGQESITLTSGRAHDPNKND